MSFQQDDSVGTDEGTVWQKGVFGA